MTTPMDPTLEAFFVAIALQHGTHPMPKFGIERNKLIAEVALFIKDHPGAPTILEKVRRNYAELGSKIPATDQQWFWGKVAGSYLNWLYMQDESKNLLAESLEELTEQQRAWATEGRGIAQSKRGWKF